MDYGIIVPRIEALYAFTAQSLGDARIQNLVRDGVPAYVWPADAREPWLSGSKRIFARVLAWATGARSAGP